MSALSPQGLKRTSWRQGEPLEQTGWVGVPLTYPLQSANWHGGRGGHIGFSPVLPQSGKLAMEQFRRTYQRYKEFGMDYQASFAIGERHMLNINAILFNKGDEAMMKRIDPFIRTLVADAKANGYGEYRTHLDYMDTVADSYDFNDHALLRLNERVKDALDPRGIIAPGKSGGVAAGVSEGAQGMKKTFAFSIAVVAVVTAIATAQTSPPADGKALYKEKCVMCHDKTGMGTGLLSRRVKVAELLLRTDLNPQYIVASARSGIGNMPAIARGEVSDRDLQAIADYLTQPLEARK